MKRKLFAVCVGIAAVTAAMLMAGYSPGKGHLACDYLEGGEQVCVSARVTYKDGSKIYLDSIIIRECAAISQQNIPIKDRLIIEYGEILYGAVPKIGQTVVVQGVFSEYSQAANPGEFDMAQYYHRLRVGGKLKCAEVIGRSEEYSLLKEKLYERREIFKERLFYVFPEKEAGIMCTILLGDKSELDGEVKELYRRNGIIHILSISGLHISLVGMGIYKALRKAGMSGRPAAVIGCVVLMLYGMLTGMGISVCRAVGMYLIRMLSVMIGRTYDMLTALGVAGAILVLQNPLCLRQAGFLLSFGAVMGVGIICPALLPEESGEPGKLRYEPSKCRRVIKRRLSGCLAGLYSSAVSGVSITLMTLPIQLWFYYETPTYSVILNLFVLPLMGVLLVTGLIAMLIPYMGIAGTVSVLILNGYESLCGLFERLPMNMWNPGRPSEICVILYYGILAAAVWYAYYMKGNKRSIQKNNQKSSQKFRRGSNKTWSVLVYLSILIVLTALMGIHAAPKNSVTFLDVGQGDGIVVRTDAGGVYLFDCGSTDKSRVGEYVLKPYLKYYGISRIDGVIVSHEDADHCNGIEELLENRRKWGIDVGNILLPKVEGEAFEGILTACERGGKALPDQCRNTESPNVIYINAGTCWQDGSARFTCLHPEKGQEAENINASSGCFLVESGGWTLLLTGDVEAEGESQLLEEIKKAGITGLTILKVAHHGSGYSTSAEFLDTVRPRFSVISCGKNNVYGHPHEALLERLVESGTDVWLTMESGAVTMWSDKSGAKNNLRTEVFRR